MGWRNPLTLARRQMMQELSRIVRDTGTVDLDWLIGYGGKTWGYTEETIMRMLEQLQKCGDIEIHNSIHTVSYAGSHKTATPAQTVNHLQEEDNLPEKFRLPKPPKKINITRKVRSKEEKSPNPPNQTDPPMEQNQQEASAK